MSSKTIVRNRTKAFVQQLGRCCYCGTVMWTSQPESYAETYGLTQRQANQFMCTAEHKLARQDGGRNTADNIAAACLRCNQRRHARRKPLDSLKFLAYVVSRTRTGAWLTVGASGSSTV